MDKRKIIAYWRKYGAAPILITQILTGFFFSNIIYGIVFSLWFTVPCGIKIINRIKWMWYIRQAIIFIIVYFFIFKL